MKLNICGFEIEVDLEDVDRILAKRWHSTESVGGKIRLLTYAECEGRRVRTTLARFIFNSPADSWVSQIHGADEFDYRKSSWRVSSMSERQSMLSSSSRRIKTSKYKGVSKDYKADMWRASIRPQGLSIYLGVYATEIEAALAYDRAARLHFGPKAFQNFSLSIEEDSEAFFDEIMKKAL